MHILNTIFITQPITHKFWIRRGHKNLKLSLRYWMVVLHWLHYLPRARVLPRLQLGAAGDLGFDTLAAPSLRCPAPWRFRWKPHWASFSCLVGQPAGVLHVLVRLNIIFIIQYIRLIPATIAVSLSALTMSGIIWNSAFVFSMILSFLAIIAFYLRSWNSFVLSVLAI